MFTWIKDLFSGRKPHLLCGGEGLCDVLVRGKLAGQIKYRRPTSDEKLDYAYQIQKGIGTESQLKELEGEKENKARKCHQILIRDLSLPFAKLVFLGSVGFRDDQNKLIEGHNIEKQFDIISKYYGYALVDFVAEIFKSDVAVKKKY